MLSSSTSGLDASSSNGKPVNKSIMEHEPSDPLAKKVISFRKAVEEYKEIKDLHSRILQKKLVKLLEMTETDCTETKLPFKLTILQPVPKLIEQFSDSLTCRVPDIPKSQYKQGWIRRTELIDLMLQPEKTLLDVMDMIKNTYMCYFTDEELFSYLVAKFCAVPFNMNYEEKKIFLENYLSKVQQKILFFMRFWFKEYSDSVLMDDQVGDLFVEVLMIFMQYAVDRKGIKNSIRNMIGYAGKEKFISEVAKRIVGLTTNKGVTERIARLSQDAANEAIFFEYFFKLLKDENRKLAEQICIFDHDNLQLILPNELIASKQFKHKREVAQNVAFIDEAANRLARLLALHILYVKNKSELVRRLDDVIQLADNLMFLNNFNSLHAVYLGFRNPNLVNLMSDYGINVSSRANDVYNKITGLMSVAGSQQTLRKLQLKAQAPKVPYVNELVRDINNLYERKQTSKLDKVHLSKMWELHEYLEKFTETKKTPYPDSYKPDSKIQFFLRNLPSAERTENQIQLKTKEHRDSWKRPK